MPEWISSHLAAKLLGVGDIYFRRTYCRQDLPLVTLRENGQTGHGRRYLVLRASVEDLKAKKEQRAMW